VNIVINRNSRPSDFSLSAHPNPFNSSVTIVLDCHSRENENPEGFAIEIYDVNGRRVAVAEPVEATVCRLAKDTSTSSVSVKSPLIYYL